MWKKIIKNQVIKRDIFKGEIKAILWTALGFVAIWKSAKAWYGNGCEVSSGLVTTAADNLGITDDLVKEIKTFVLRSKYASKWAWHR